MNYFATAQKNNAIILINHNGDNNDGNEHEHKTGLVVAPAKPELKKPKKYKVLLLNDDYTTMDFVIMVLEQIFYKNRDEAVQVMLHVHQRGKGVCGIYIRDIAETKVQQVLELAKEHGHPLQCVMQPE